MNVFFETCSDAEENALKNRSYGVFYSEAKDHNHNVHVHECCELFFCLEGGDSFLIDDKLYDMSDGDLFAINQFEAHKVVPDNRDLFKRYILHIHPAFLYAVSETDIDLADCFFAADRPHKINLSNADKQKLMDLFESLKDNNEYADQMYKRLRITEILLETNRIFSTRTEQIGSNSAHKTVQIVIDYINNNYASEITLDDIAKKVCLSANQLCRIFNKYRSTTVTKYLISKRITEAKKLLADGKSVTDTAYLCGFNDYANFIKTFKKTVGVSPGKYRASIR